MLNFTPNPQGLFFRKKVCFFSTVPKEKLIFENYSIQDLRILSELGFEIIICNSFFKIPLYCDLYFSWWASGSFLPLIKAKISGKPIITIAGGNEVMFYKDSITNEPAGYLKYPIWKQLLIKLTLKFSNEVVVVSGFMLSNTKKLGALNLNLIHNCVDTNTFYKQLPSNDYIISIFKIDKNTVKLKRGEVFIKSIKEVVKYFPNQKFLIIGKKGDDFSRIFNLVNKLKLNNNIEFTDEIDNLSVMKLVSRSKLYVQISDTETFSLSIAEAMSCEVPVLVSKCGAIPEIVGEKGIYVDHNCVQNVSKEVINFLNLSKIKQLELGTQLRDRIIDKFSYENRKNKLSLLIHKVFKNERRRL